MADYLNDLYEYTEDRIVWRDLGPSTRKSTPTARALHGFTALGDSIYLFGGASGSTFTGRPHTLRDSVSPK